MGLVQWAELARLEHMFDNVAVDYPELPDAKVSDPNAVMAPGGHRRPAFEPVVFRVECQWRFGVVHEWIGREGYPWIARIVFAASNVHQYYEFYDYLKDGAIVPLEVDTANFAVFMSPRSWQP